jgi:hypothetical protein
VDLCRSLRSSPEQSRFKPLRLHVQLGLVSKGSGVSKGTFSTPFKTIKHIQRHPEDQSPSSKTAIARLPFSSTSTTRSTPSESVASSQHQSASLDLLPEFRFEHVADHFTGDSPPPMDQIFRRCADDDNGTTTITNTTMTKTHAASAVADVPLATSIFSGNDMMDQSSLCSAATALCTLAAVSSTSSLVLTGVETARGVDASAHPHIAKFARTDDDDELSLSLATNGCYARKRSVAQKLAEFKDKLQQEIEGLRTKHPGLADCQLDVTVEASPDAADILKVSCPLCEKSITVQGFKIQPLQRHLPSCAEKYLEQACIAMNPLSSSSSYLKPIIHTPSVAESFSKDSSVEAALSYSIRHAVGSSPMILGNNTATLEIAIARRVGCTKVTPAHVNKLKAFFQAGGLIDATSPSGLDLAALTATLDDCNLPVVITLSLPAASVRTLSVAADGYCFYACIAACWQVVTSRRAGSVDVAESSPITNLASTLIDA